MACASGCDFDLLLIGDFRFPGGTSTAIAEAIQAQFAAGYRTGLVQRQAPILKQDHPIHPAIQACIDAGFADPVEGTGPLDVQLVELHSPHLFETAQPAVRPIQARRKVLVAHHPPVDGFGRATYDVATIAEHAEALIGPGLHWSPVSPGVRRRLIEGWPRLALTKTDWPNIIDAESWNSAARDSAAGDSAAGLKPAKRGDGCLVIGRHARPDWRKWPETRERILLSLPADPAFEVRILGGGAFLTELMRPFPVNWEALGFDGMEVPTFLAGLDVFVYHHHPTWFEAFGRTVLEAMASGLPCVLAPAFESTFGDAALYAPLEDVPALLRRLHADPAWRAQQGRIARRRAADQFGPQRRIAWLESEIGKPAPRRRAALKRNHAPQRRVMLATSNGIGMGHLTRQLAIAKRLPRDLTPVFVTLSQALPVVEAFGYLAEYLPSNTYLGIDDAEWNVHLARAYDHLLDLYRPEVLVFDGNRPYDGLVAAMRRWPDCKFVWSRRAMWSANADPAPLAHQPAFDLVLEPMDIAETLDSGPTVPLRETTRRVAPITLLDESEYLSRAAARAELGIRSGCTAVLVQLGSGNNRDVLGIVAKLMHTLGNRRNIELRLVEWVISEDRLDMVPGLSVLRTFPVARYLRAFDFAVSAVGYNSFHELIAMAVPALFVPNLDASMDDQKARADFAASRGAAAILLPEELESLPDLLKRFLDPEQRRLMADACRALHSRNGAGEAAAIVADLATRTTS